MRERLALNVMFHVGMAFRNAGETIYAAQISKRINIPSIALTPIVNALEEAGLILPTENENLLPGREMSRTKLSEILDVVRVRGETGSHRDPNWSDGINVLGESLDNAVAEIVADRTLADLLDEQEKNA
jgi:DNA-binding IscR family transcriptional regulator